MDQAQITQKNSAENHTKENGQSTRVAAESQANHTKIKNDSTAQIQEYPWNSMDYVYGP